MIIESLDRQLIELLQHGLPLVSRPYSSIGLQLDISENEVITRLSRLKKRGLISRLGVVVNHRQLGYNANAMVVFDVPDKIVDRTGGRLSQFGFVNLCYQRPRCGEQWPYNLYCMIHGKDKQKVLEQLDHLLESSGLQQFKHEVLFSKKCFKQRGALYQTSPLVENEY